MFENFKNKILNNSLAKNSLIIMIGQTLSSIVSFFSVFLMLKGIGVYGQGVIAIIQSYTNIFNGIFNFQSYNAMIKYGADAQESGDKYKLKQYMKQSLIQDLITASLAFGVGLAFIGVVSRFMKWDTDVTYFAKIFLITIPFNITGSINGFLRLNNEFKIGANIAVKIAIIKLLLVIIAVYSRLGIIYFVYIEIITSILNNIMFFYFGYKSLKRNSLHDFWKVKIKFDREFTMFNFYNNIVSTIDMPTGTLVNIIINKLLGINEVGIYSVLVKLGGLITRITEPIAQSLLPELSKLVAQNNEKSAHKLIKKILFSTLAVGGAIVILSTITSPIWLKLFLEINLENIILVELYFIYVFIAGAVSGIHLLFVSLNLVKYNVKITIICNSIYLILMYFLAIGIGLVGVIFALIIQAIMIALFKYITMKKVNLDI